MADQNPGNPVNPQPQLNSNIVNALKLYKK